MQRALHSFPTRRSSDLPGRTLAALYLEPLRAWAAAHGGRVRDDGAPLVLLVEDRKSTRLNSSHLGISYAVFCLNKKMLLWSNADVIRPLGVDRRLAARV